MFQILTPKTLSSWRRMFILLRCMLPECMNGESIQVGAENDRWPAVCMTNAQSVATRSAPSREWLGGAQ